MEAQEGDLEGIPTSWGEHPSEVSQARRLYVKYRGGDEMLGKEAFELMVRDLIGSGGMTKSKKEIRTQAWNSVQEKQVCFKTLLKVLTDSGITPRAITRGYKSAMQADTAMPTTCPHCLEHLPSTYTFKNEEKEGDIRRSSLGQDPPYSSLGEEISPPTTEASSPARHDPRTSRLNASEKELLVTSLETISRLGISEVLDVSVMLQSLTRKGDGWLTDSDTDSEKKRIIITASEDTLPLSPPVRTPPKVGKILIPPREVDKKIASPRNRTSIQSTGSSGSNRSTTSAAFVPAPPSGLSPLSARGEGTQSVAPVIASRHARRASNPYPQTLTQQSKKNLKTLSSPKRASHTPLKRSGSGSAAKLFSTTQNGSQQGMPAPPPLLTARERLPIDETKTPFLQNLSSAVLRRTEKLIDTVKRVDVKSVAQWASGAELNVLLKQKESSEGVHALPHVAVAAKGKGSGEILASVLTSTNIKLYNEYGETPLHQAARCGSVDKLRILLDFLTKAGLENLDSPLLPFLDVRKETPLHVAVRHSQVSCISLLLQHEMGRDNLNKISHYDEKKTAFHMAGTPEILGLLLDHNVETSLLDEQGHTGLHCAVISGVFENRESHVVLKRLCGIPSLVKRVVPQTGNTALHLAVEKKQTNLATAMSVHGADYECQNNAKLGCLQLAQRQWQQTAGTSAQLEWSALLMAWGRTLESITTSRGTAWYMKGAFGWTRIDQMHQNPTQSLYATIRQDGKLEWSDPKPRTPLVDAVMSMESPDKGVTWKRLLAHIPETPHPTQRVEISLTPSNDPSCPATFQVRCLPVV